MENIVLAAIEKLIGERKARSRYPLTVLRSELIAELRDMSVANIDQATASLASLGQIKLSSSINEVLFMLPPKL